MALLFPVVLLGALVCGANAVLRAPFRPVFRRRRLTVPAAWPNLSLVHISDLHVRDDHARLSRAQALALAGLEPDLLCVTGDVCETILDVPSLVAVLRSARPRLGTFIVLGNHEHGAPKPRQHRGLLAHLVHDAVNRALTPFSPAHRSSGSAEGHAIADALRSAGLVVLHNQGVRIAGPAGTLWLAGCDSAWAGHADMAAAMAGRRLAEPCLALVHEPDLAFSAAAHGADVILAGHTHGGQIRLPIVGAPYTHRLDPRIRIASGFQRIGSAWLHITTGLGHTIALRFACPPEVVWFDCVATMASDAPAASDAAAASVADAVAAEIRYPEASWRSLTRTHSSSSGPPAI